MKPTFQEKWVYLFGYYTTVYKWASPQYMIYCFANISIQKACAVTRKLDVDQMSVIYERHKW